MIRTIGRLAAAGLGLLLLAGPAGGHDAGAAEPGAGGPAIEAPGLDDGASYDYRAPEPGSYRLPPIGEAVGGRVLDERGAERELAALLGERVTLLSFIYTRCSDPEGCPLATAALFEVQDRSPGDPMLAEGLQLISLSFDPEHDTPAVMAEFAEAAVLDGGAPWRYVTPPDEAALRPILEGYDQAVGTKQDAADPYGPLTHQLRVYLVDRQRRIRNIYSLGFLDPRLMLADVRSLLLEERGIGPDRRAEPGG